MANKKNKIDKSLLPLVNFENKYIVRYRIIEDKVKASDWSMFYSVPAKPVSQVQGVIRHTVVGSSATVDIIWENTNNLPLYDIFIKYNSSDKYTYHGKTQSSNYSLIPAAGKTSIYVLVQAASVQKRVSTPNLLKVFEGNNSW
jgi:hypothetical protein